MSAITTTTSSSRPTNPDKGDVFFETDTNRILVWDGGMWHVYNRDSVSFTTANTEEIHYPQGIYSDTTASYYIATSPILHFDSSHIDGLTKTSPYADGQWVQYWYDRTHNRYKYQETQPGVDPEMVDSGNSVPFVRDNGARYYPATGENPPTSISGEFTLMYVMNPTGNSYMSPAPYIPWWRDSSGYSSFHFAGLNLAPAIIASSQTDYFKTVTSTTGPCIHIGRNSQTHGVQVWKPDERGFVRPAWSDFSKTFPYATGSYDISSFLHAYAMDAYEVIWWDHALTIAEINTVKDYFQNKYLGLNDDFFPVGGTPQLVET